MRHTRWWVSCLVPRTRTICIKSFVIPSATLPLPCQPLSPIEIRDSQAKYPDSHIAHNKLIKMQLKAVYFAKDIRRRVVHINMIGCQGVAYSEATQQATHMWAYRLCRYPAACVQASWLEINLACTSFRYTPHICMCYRTYRWKGGKNVLIKATPSGLKLLSRATLDWGGKREGDTHTPASVLPEGAQEAAGRKCKEAAPFNGQEQSEQHMAEHQHYHHHRNNRWATALDS